MTYEMHFVAINGVQPNIPQNVEENLNVTTLSPDKDDAARQQQEPADISGKNIVQVSKQGSIIKAKDGSQIQNGDEGISRQ